MTEYWSGAITFTGLGSGTDFQSIIEATMSVESYRLNQMEEWAAEWEQKVELLEAINTELVEYASFLETIDSMDEFMAKYAQSTDSSAVAVSVESEATEGSHTITVDQLAANDIQACSTGYESTDDAVCTTDQTFSFTYAGELMELDVPANTSLKGLMDIINNSPDVGGDVRARIIDDGSENHLLLQGMDLGEENTIVIQDTGFTGFTPSDFTNTQTAANARLRVDGYPPESDSWIERDTNTIDDVIEGMTLYLYDTTDSAGEIITVGTDTDTTIANIETFISKTNEIRQMFLELEEEVSADGDVDSYTPLSANYGVDFVEQGLENILASSGVGFRMFEPETGFGDRFTVLSTIGITTDSDQNSDTFGHLLIDYDILEAALEEDPDSVAALFAADMQGESDTADFTYVSAIKSITEPGTYEVEYEVIDGAVAWATIGGEEAMISGREITGAANTSAAGVVVSVNSLSDGEYSGNVYLKQGKVLETIEALERMTSEEDGYLTIISDNYQDIVDNTYDSIAQEEARLELKQASLVRKYAQLESVLTEYNGIQDELEYQISQLE